MFKKIVALFLVTVLCCSALFCIPVSASSVVRPVMDGANAAMFIGFLPITVN